MAQDVNTKCPAGNVATKAEQRKIILTFICAECVVLKSKLKNKLAHSAALHIAGTEIVITDSRLIVKYL